MIGVNSIADVGLAVGLAGLDRLLFLDARGLAVHATHGGFGDRERVELVPGRRR